MTALGGRHHPACFICSHCRYISYNSARTNVKFYVDFLINLFSQKTIGGQTVHCGYCRSGFQLSILSFITKTSFRDVLRIESHILWIKRDFVLQEFPFYDEYLNSGPSLEGLLPFDNSLSSFNFLVVLDNESTQVLCLNDYLLMHSPTCAACRQEIRPVPDTGVLVRVSRLHGVLVRMRMITR